jgi:hypothetical protein
MSMARRNIAAGVALAGFACWYAYLTGNLPDRDVMPNTPGPAFFPTLIATLILVLATAMAVVGFRQLRSEAAGGAEPFVQREGAYAIIAFLIYLVALTHAGFIIASIPFFAVLMYLYGGRNLAVLALVSVVVPVVLYVVFRHGFHVVLPRGPLTF